MTTIPLGRTERVCRLIGADLRKKRGTKGLRAAAEAYGCSPDMVERIERGEGLEVLVQITAFLDSLDPNEHGDLDLGQLVYDATDQLEI
ncbi:MAG TPA: helix-turn-helix transcriptional regulator [Pirellulales bacterium]|jgi:hypothetical protein|nr:helix-turn-helix transcriptional regulator [Pirellulales bacterium]